MYHTVHGQYRPWSPMALLKAGKLWRRQTCPPLAEAGNLSGVNSCLQTNHSGTVIKDGYFKDYYQRKLETKNRFDHLIKKKEGLCAVVIKRMKVMFALMRDRRMFDDKADALPLAA